MCPGLQYAKVSILLLTYWVAVQGGNINVDDTCSISSSCLPCLNRNSEQIQRCQQLYFFITYSTGDSNTRNNEAEISRYCNGECPIILATADYYCQRPLRLASLLQMCPSYSEIPSGSLQINNEGSNCLSGQGRCSQCIGADNQGAVRCLQLYLLATNPNTSSTYASRYCEGNCPLTLQSFSSYCSIPITDFYSYCQQSGGQYCGALRYQSLPSYSNAVSSCTANCLTAECTAAINEYGCCLRQSLGDRCSNIPNDCNLPVDASTNDLRISDLCSISRCSSCLSRDTRDLQRCEQLYSYLVAAEGIQATQAASVRRRFCSGNCPILLITADRLCGSNRPTSTLWQICPSYNRIPSSSVDIRASFGNQSCSVASACEECILSNSPQPTRCLQLSLLTNHPNMSNFYSEEFCRGNCPLTMSTYLWYCTNNEVSVSSLFQGCRRNRDDTYCSTLANDGGFNAAVTACRADCNSTACVNGVQQYDCCMNGQFNSESCMPQSQPSPCAIVTAAAPPPNIMASPILFVFLLVFHLLASVLH